MNKIYRLMGTMSNFKEENSFVYPIFEQGGDYYFEHSDSTLHIQSFEKVDGLDHISKIKRLEEDKVVGITKREYQVNEEAILAYQEDDNHLFIGTMDDMIAYYDNMNSSNPLTNMVVNNMKEQQRRSKRK